MLSLASQDYQEHVEAWQQRLMARLGPQQQALAQRWVVEPKIDGLAVCATYRAGQLEQVGQAAAAGCWWLVLLVQHMPARACM
jgi:NAD-dependent DNA ligase